MANLLVVWEVVGGSDKGGILVRRGQDLKSPEESERLSTGSLVVQRELVGERLRYDRIEGSGTGPDSGWVSLRAGKTALLLKTDGVLPPPGGWKILSKPLESAPAPAKAKAVAPAAPAAPTPAAAPAAGYPAPAASPPPAAPASPSAKEASDPIDENTGDSVVQSQNPQKAGQPYVFYHQIAFIETKETGLRMSAIFSAMDLCRTEMMCLCDQSMEAFRKVTNPFTQVIMELKPAIKTLSDEVAHDGLLYTNPKSRGPVLSWLRCEGTYGWPMFPFRTEEQQVFLVGKQKESSQRTPIASARFLQAFVDDTLTPAMPLSGDKWESFVDRFWAKVKKDHSSPHLNEFRLQKLYPSSDKPFVPTKYAQVSWLMSHVFGDLWAILYHGRTPELLWDLNMLAGGPFAALVDGEPDPQALVINLPKKMEVGKVYDALCYLDEASRKVVYVLLPKGARLNSECVLVVMALYNWNGAPENGQTLTAEDVELVLGGAPRGSLITFATGAEVKATRLFDLSKLPKP